jgi:hypothetical protein
MRTIDAAMQAVINGHTKCPAITMTVEDHIQHFTQWSNPGIGDGYNDWCLASDNSIIRCYIDRTSGSSPFTRTIYYQKITDPANGSQWSSWTNLSGGITDMFQDGSCAISNNGGTLRIFGQRGSDQHLLAWTSTNNGASWSGPVTVLTPPGAANIKGIGSAGNNDVFFIYDVSGGEALAASFWNGASWSAINTWSLPNIQAGYGIDAIWSGGVYTLFYSDGYNLFSCQYNPGSNTWSPDSNIAPATSTAIGRVAPRISMDSNGLYTVTCIEYDAGLLTGSVYSYPRLRQSTDLVHWSNGFILHDINETVTYGAIFIPFFQPSSGNAGQRAYISTTAYVYSSPIFSRANSAQYVDVSGSVLSYRRVEKTNKPAQIEVIIDNNRGQYNGFISTPGVFRPLGPNTSIVISEGYKTGNPPTTNDIIQTAVYHIKDLHIERTPDENQLKLVALDKSRLLDYQSRYQQTYNNKTVGYLVAEVLARAGLFSPVISSTSNTAQTVPQFIIHAGRAYRAALDELCTVYGLYYFLDQNEIMQVRELSSGDSSIWTYQPEIEMVSFVTSDLRANHIVVSGKPPATGQAGALTTAEAYDDAHNAWVGQEQLLHEVDTKLTTTSQCSARASLSLAREQRAQVAHVVTVPVNPALQLFDVITLIDSAAPTGSGQSGNARIVEQTIVYDAQHAVYEHHIALEGV